MQEDAIKRLRVEASESGVTETTQKVGQLTKAEVDLETAQIRRASAQVQLVNAQNRQMIQYQQMLNVQQQFSAANDNTANSTNHVADILRAATKAVVDYAAGWAATAGAIGAGVILFGEILAVLTPLILTYKLIKDVVGLATEAWRLGGEELDKFRKIAEDAAKVDLSTTFFQQITKGAEASGAKVDDLTKALQNLQKATADQLGGSTLQQRLDQHLTAGNFGDNPGIAQLNQANTSEERFKAIAAIIHTAMQDGQRLAAIDLANTAFGSDVANHLRQDSEYLDKMLESAAKIKDTEIVSPEEIGRAAELQARYDAAVKILEQRWHPIQDLLTQLGIKMRETWVDIVSSIAKGVDWAVKLAIAIGDALNPYLKYLQIAENIVGKGLQVAGAAVPGAGAVVGAIGTGISAATASQPTQATDAYSVAVNKLRAGLQNQNAVQQAVNQTNAVANKVLGDNSKTLDDNKQAIEAQRDAYDRAKDAVEKHTAQLIADQKSVGLGVQAQAEFRASAQLTTAALQSGREITAELAAEIDNLAKAQGRAAYNNAVAQAQNKADFDLQTVFLTGTEKQIADINFQLHGNKWKEFGDDGLSNTMRVASALKDVRDTAQQFTSDFIKGLMSGKTGMEALAQAATNLSQKLTDKALTDLFSGNFIQAGIEGIGAAVSYIVGKSAQKDADLEKAKQAWANMKDQVIAFNHAAAGFNLGPLTQALQSLAQTELELAKAAYNAHDTAGLAQVQNTFNQGVVRLVNEFQRGSDTLTPYAQALKDLNSEAQGLIETLNSEHLQGAAGAVAAALPDRVAALTKQYTDNLVSDLTNRLNTANGQDYLNSAAALLAQHNQDIASAQQLGVSMDLVNQTFAAGAQKIVNDANLTGSAFDAFIAKFPELAGVVQQATAVISRSADQIAQAKQSYQDQLFALQQDQTTLAGQLAVFDRQADEARAAEVAQGGQALVDLEALQAAQRLDIIQKFNDQQLQAAQQAADQFKSFLTQFTNTIRTYLDGLTAGSGSPLSPQARLAAAQSQYNTQLALAQGGDQTAAGNITQYATNLLDAAKSLYASSSGFQSIFSQVQSQLGALPSQVSATQQVINAINSQTTALQTAFASGSASAIAAALLPQFNSLNIAAGSGLTFAQFQSIAGGLASQSTLQSVFSTLDTDGNGQIDRLEAIKVATGSTNTNIGTASGSNTLVVATNNAAAVTNSLYVLSNNTLPSISSSSQTSANNSAFLPTISNQLGLLATINGTLGNTNVYLSAMRQMMQQQNAHWAGGAIPGFASGTDSAPGGLALIGERGPEIMNVPRGAQIIPNNRINVTSANDNAALVAELRELRRLVAMGVKVDGEGHAKTSDAVERVVQETGRRTTRVRSRAA